MTMNLDERIAQWETMAREAPDDMAFFSLGDAYRAAKRLDEAAKAFAEAIRLNPNLSRAYQLCGQTLMDLGRDDEAAKVFTEGYVKAADRGDAMVQRAIAAMLQRMGKPLPQVKAPTPSAPPPVDPNDPNAILDRRTGKPGTRLPNPPIRGPVGRFIQAHFSRETWQEWIRQGTKVINELRLDFSRPDHSKVYDMHMMEWLGVSEQEVEEFERREQKISKS
jgi:Fe-S cluster biosynthesis and repair protein YggX